MILGTLLSCWHQLKAPLLGTFQGAYGADQLRSELRRAAHLRSVLCISLALLVGLVSSNLRADTLTGEVRGTVLDVDGNLPLTDVGLTLENVDRGWQKTTTTDRFGNFAFLQIEPGNYTVKAEFDAYYPQEKTGVLVRLNQPKVVLPPFQLRKEVATATATRQITLRGEQTRTAVVDLTSTGPNPVVLAYLSEPGTTSMLALLDSAIRANYAGSIIPTLPLRGVRSFDQLALLSPGVFRVPFSAGQGPAVGIGVGTAGQFSVNGMRGRSNNFTIDGSDNNDEDIGVRRQGFVSLVPQSSESVSEFQIITAGFPAEFGRNAGSMVNAVSRSGSQQHHGQVYAILGHDGLSSDGFFQQPFQDMTNPGNLNGGSFTGRDFSESLIGGVLGGPLASDRLFYFASAEVQRRRGSALGHFAVPGNEERGLMTRHEFVPIAELGDFFAREGIFNPDLPGRVIYSSFAGESVFSLYPLPNNPTGPFDDHTYSQAQPAEGDGLVLSLKQDWYLSDTHSFSARYNFTDDESMLPFTSDSLNSSLATNTRTQNLSLFLNSSTTRWANALRVSYGRTALDFPAEKSSPFLFGSSVPEEIPPSLASFSPFRQVIRTPYGEFGPFGATGPIGQLTIAPYAGIGIDVFNFPQLRVDNTFQYADAVTYSTSRHTFKFGADIRRSQLNSSLDRNSRPLLFFGQGLLLDPFGPRGCETNAFCRFDPSRPFVPGTDLAALGTPAGFLQSLTTQAVPDNTIGLRFTQFDFFVQDNWRIVRNFSLNLGVRYELQSVPREQNQRIERALQSEQPRLEPSDFPNQGNQNIVNFGNIGYDLALQAYREFVGVRQSIFELDRDNLAPRIGFAWDPSGKGKWVIRAGYGIAYDANLGAVTSQSRNIFPTFLPINLDANFAFNVPQGLLVPNSVFFSFTPTGENIVRPGMINQFGAAGGGPATGIGTLFLNTRPGGLSVNGLAFTLPDREFRTTYAQHYLFSLQHQFGRNHVLTTEYVGSRGVNLTRFTTPNLGPISTPSIRSDFLNPIVVGAISPVVIKPDPTPSMPDRVRLARPFEGLGAFTTISNSAQSSYHSLQLKFQRRSHRRLQWQAQYTWGHSIDEVSDPFAGRGFFAQPQDSFNLAQERASANFDSRHRFSFYLLWESPQSVSKWLRNWTVSLIGEMQSGQPYTVNTSLDRNRDGNLTDRLNTMTGLLTRPDEAVSISLTPGTGILDLVAPERSNGLVGRNTFTSDGLSMVDLALSRRFSVWGDSTVTFRLEAFNLLDQTSFGIPVRILESPAFGRSYDTQVPARSFRLSIKFAF